MKNGLSQTIWLTSLYTALIFLIAWYAHFRKEAGKSIVNNPYAYTLSMAVYCTSWTYYGSVGRAATSGIDYILIYLGPSLTAFSWFFVLRRIIRISRDNNITSLADFISLRYGKSPWLGALVTVLAILAAMPYIALQIKAVSTSFFLISGISADSIGINHGTYTVSIPNGFLLALTLSIFGIIFGARRLVSSERHEGLMAAVAFESIIKLAGIVTVGIFVTYVLHHGFRDIFSLVRSSQPETFSRLFTINSAHSGGETIYPFTMLFMSMGAIMLLPRQFHVMVIENFSENHVGKAMWLFPLYLALINLFIIPIALGGLLLAENTANADFFVLSIPLLAGYHSIAALAYLGGLSAAAGMVMVESVTISTMLLNNIFMPIIVHLSPRSWFPFLLINLKRVGIFFIIFLGYVYYLVVGNNFSLVNLGMYSFSAVIQFLPAMLGGIYWRRGNKTGAFSGILLGLVIWGYTLFLPSLAKTGWFHEAFLRHGPFGICILKPTALFGLSGMDQWSHALFWSMFFNIGCYIIGSTILDQDDQEKEQIHKFFGSFEIERRRRLHAETRRLSKPVTIQQFESLLAKFLGEEDAQQAVFAYLESHPVSNVEAISEFELPNVKRFTEKTLAGSVGAAAAAAIVDSFLSDMGSRMELVYDIFSTVRTSLDQSREALFVRLKASEIINRTLDLQIIMNELLDLLIREFRLDNGLMLRRDSKNDLHVVCHKESAIIQGSDHKWLDVIIHIGNQVVSDRATYVVNDTAEIPTNIKIQKLRESGVVSCAFIPIFRENEIPSGVLVVLSNMITGMFTREFINLLESLAGQLAQTFTISREIEAKEHERSQKELALLQNARITRDMEIAQQIQQSLLPSEAPHLFGIELGGQCISAAHVGGDYYDFFLRDDHTVDLLIADVSGHSVGAALIMAEVRTLLRPQINSANSACTILQLLNGQLFDDLTRAELFITMFYAKYNSATGRLSYANAGHNRPVVCRDNEVSCIELDAEGLIIGMKPSVIFEEKSIVLQKGDVVLFFTDGLIEATNQAGELYGVDRVCNHLRTIHQLSVPEIISSFYTEVSEYIQSESFQDDISLVVLKIS